MAKQIISKDSLIGMMQAKYPDFKGLYAIDPVTISYDNLYRIVHGTPIEDVLGSVKMTTLHHQVRTKHAETLMMLYPKVNIGALDSKDLERLVVADTLGEITAVLGESQERGFEVMQYKDKLSQKKSSRSYSSNGSPRTSLQPKFRKRYNDTRYHGS